MCARDRLLQRAFFAAISNNSVYALALNASLSQLYKAFCVMAPFIDFLKSVDLPTVRADDFIAEALAVFEFNQAWTLLACWLAFNSVALNCAFFILP